MSRTTFLAIVGLLIVCTTAPAQWESGSDGSDGAFSPAVSTEVDLGLAESLCDCDGDSQIDDPCRWDCPSPVPGRGIYDAEQWVIVFKYSTVNVPSGVTVTFKNHPSNPPVVWLATGNTTISGTVNLNGTDGLTSGLVPAFAQGGPGAYEGGQRGHEGLAQTATSTSLGHGPGASGLVANFGGTAAHATVTALGTGLIYGNSNAQPLTGGSGGGAYYNPNSSGGGGGGGAMLIASDTNIVIAGTGRIFAQGGFAGDGCATGSSGTIRLRAETLTVNNGSQIYVHPRTNQNGLGSGAGRVRIEAFSFTNNGTILGELSATNTPSVVFNSVVPQLRIVGICGQNTPTEPISGIMSTEVEINTGGSCTIDIEAEGIPVGTTVNVRVIPARGNVVTATSSPLADAGGGLRTATASVSIAGGRSEVQLRANW